ncbi:hypothetical protein LTS15_001693 [Exophiala xenobiotica]|nr:hypothetical protein LTS15_001693 [Exophiala xenobiotica]
MPTDKDLCCPLQERPVLATQCTTFRVSICTRPPPPTHTAPSTQVATYATDNPSYVNGKNIVYQKLKSLRDVKNVRLANKTFAMVVGEKPNYHEVRVESVKKLENVIKKGGLIFKAQKIKDCLDAVFAKNVALLQPEEVVYTLNDPIATDFVPGLLSMEYIYAIYEEGGKQAAFDARSPTNNKWRVLLLWASEELAVLGFHLQRDSTSQPEQGSLVRRFS